MLKTNPVYASSGRDFICRKAVACYLKDKNRKSVAGLLSAGIKPKPPVIEAVTFQGWLISY